MQKKKRRLPRLIFIFLFIAVVGVGASLYAYWYFVAQPNFFTENKEPVELYILPDDTYEDIVQKLQNLGLKNKTSFEVLAEQKKYPDLIKQGKYTLNNGMSNNALINKLRLGEQDEINVQINASRIQTKAELASLIGNQLMCDSAELIALLNDDAYLYNAFRLNSSTSLTLIIPNTYRFRWTTSADDFLKRMAREYKAFWTEERKLKAGKLDLSQSEVAILASIVQKESHIYSEKRKIAGVYINRLKKGMLLQADPTLIFAKGDPSIRRVLNKDKEIESPYNTYKYKGLPPGPIALPSIESLDAVLNYQDHDYLYFVAKPGGSGESNYAKSYSEHLRNARAFQRYLNEKKIMR